MHAVSRRAAPHLGQRPQLLVDADHGPLADRPVASLCRPFGPVRRAPAALLVTPDRMALLGLLAALLGNCRPAAWRAKRRRLQRLLAEPPRRSFRGPQISSMVSPNFRRVLVSASQRQPPAADPGGQPP